MRSVLRTAAELIARSPMLARIWRVDPAYHEHLRRGLISTNEWALMVLFGRRALRWPGMRRRLAWRVKWWAFDHVPRRVWGIVYRLDMSCAMLAYRVRILPWRLRGRCHYCHGLLDAADLRCVAMCEWCCENGMDGER